MPSQGITDIDSLCLEVRDRESRRLTEEAIAAYRGGARRSAIMSIWIAVAYDIISKVRELATQGDPAAKTFVTDLDQAIASNDLRKLQRIESDLLKIANDQFQFFARHEHDALSRLQGDRSLCAHPAFVAEDQLFQPSLELTRAHIVHALQILLVHAPLQGKSAIARFEADLLSPSFPALPEAIDAYMRSKYLDRARDTLVKNLAKGVLIAPFGAARATYVGKERQLALVLGSIANAKTAIYDETLPTFVASRFDSVGDDVLLRLCSYLEVDPRIWTWLSEPVRIRMRTLLESADAEALKAFAVFDAFAVHELSQVLLDRFDALDQTTQIGIITEHPKREFVGRALAIYADSGSYRTAELRGQALIVPLTRHFGPEDIRDLLRNAADNGQISFAAGTPEILESVFDQTRPLLDETRVDWREYVEEMTRREGGNENGCYACPGIRAKLNAA